VAAQVELSTVAPMSMTVAATITRDRRSHTQLAARVLVLVARIPATAARIKDWLAVAVS
tara:strand:+ start:333 stop:509 length:177 start_codon:yes stop_codon:yes gene_type:complete